MAWILFSCAPIGWWCQIWSNLSVRCCVLVQKVLLTQPLIYFQIVFIGFLTRLFPCDSSTSTLWVWRWFITALVVRRGAPSCVIMPSFLVTMLSFLDRGIYPKLVCTVICTLSRLHVMDLYLSKKSRSRLWFFFLGYLIVRFTLSGISSSRGLRLTNGCLPVIIFTVASREKHSCKEVYL